MSEPDFNTLFASRSSLALADIDNHMIEVAEARANGMQTMALLRRVRELIKEMTAYKEAALAAHNPTVWLVSDATGARVYRTPEAAQADGDPDAEEVTPGG